MISMLKDYKGKIEINGTEYTAEALEMGFKPVSGEICIKLYPNTKNANKNEITTSKQYRIKVKQYMTRKATPEFDFMAQWNNDNPMPLRVMQGTIEQETPGMVYMNLTGFGERTCTCMRCGRELTNPISKHYGIGPECMSKIGFINIDMEDVDTIKQKLTEVRWSGWVIKSAITEQEEVK